MARQLHSAPLRSSCSGPLHSAPASAREMQISVERKSTLSEQREGDLYREKSLPLVPEWYILVQMRTPNPCTYSGPKSTVLIDQNAAALIGQ